MAVKVYSTQTCYYCKLIKAFFKENNIEFTEVDVGANREAAQEMIDKSGQMGVPVTDIDGTIIVGFNETAIKKALKL